MIIRAENLNEHFLRSVLNEVMQHMGLSELAKETILEYGLWPARILLAARKDTVPV
jgi:hypothetical protein